MLILEGKQGIGETEFFRHLAIRPEWFAEGASIDMRNKDSIIAATEKWITELGEIDSTLKYEQSALKAFLTVHGDEYRRPYARKSEIIERRTSFCGTLNPRRH